jgi:hypothetical protein
MSRYSNARDRTMQNACAGIGVAYTTVQPTKAEIELKKRQQRRIRAAAEKPEVAPEPSAWPPCFVPSIRVDRHGRIV